MKKNSKLLMTALMMAAAMGAGLASCTTEDVEDTAVNGGQNAAKYIGYGINVNSNGSTRGTATTLSNFEVDDNTFMVWGYYSTDATGSGVTPGALYVGTSNTVGTVIKYTSPSWDYNDAADKKLWPVETAKLNFQAVSPHAYGTIINTPADGIACLGMTVTVPTAVASQQDVIFGHAEEKTYTSNATVVPLTFEHALSQVVFQGKVAEAGITATIKGVKVCNVHNTANVGFLGARYVDDNGTAEDPSDDVTTQRRLLGVSGIAATTDKFPIGMYGAADVVLTSTTATDLCASDGALMMIPQNGLTAWDPATPATKTITLADAAGQTYLEVECKIKYTDLDSYIWGSADAYAKIYVPFTVDWAIGKKYTYVLNFGSGQGGYDEDGNAAMNFISYSVASVQAWDDVAGPEYTF